MQNIIDILYFKFFNAISAAFPHLGESVKSKVEVAPSTQDKFGHYQCNSAMKLAKILKKNPHVIAKEIIENLDVHLEGKKVVSFADCAGAGFINVTIDSTYLSETLQKMFEDSRLGVELSGEPKKVVIDFSSPNVAKEMHVGHLRSTIIGDCLARLFAFLGNDVLRLNHIGDWGTQFGMLIAHMKEAASKVLSGEEEANLVSLMNWYKESKRRFDQDAVFKEIAQKEVVRLQGGDRESRRAWEIICAISRKAYQEIYDLLGVEITERGESFYNSFLAEVVEEAESKKAATISHGAKCVFLEGFVKRDGEPLPMILQKSDGGYNYATTDLAALRHRVREEHADRIIYVTDQGQRVHFQMLFSAAEKLSYCDPEKVRLDHVSFGLVLGPDGKKFKTRSGETEKLADLLSASIERAEAIMKDRGTGLSQEELKKIAKSLGIGAVKYADLSCHRNSDYLFSYDRMLRFEGNTAAFLMYAYVRIEGIKRKVGKDICEAAGEAAIRLEHPSEVGLGLHLRRFGEAIDAASRELAPNYLTDYLYELAQKFNVFFRDCRVEGSSCQDSRLLLCEVASRVMKKGLFLLGVETVEHM